MTYFATDSKAQSSRLYNAAIRKEIGERLRACLDQDSIEAPPHLLTLMERLHDEPVPNSR
jgi:hypothetical protein